MIRNQFDLLGLSRLARIDRGKKRADKRLTLSTCQGIVMRPDGVLPAQQGGLEFVTRERKA